MLAFHFNCVPRKVKEMGFHFGNLSSRYGANNLYFTKDGRPFLPIAGELHFSRLPREMWERELLKMKAVSYTHLKRSPAHCPFQIRLYQPEVV